MSLHSELREYVAAGFSAIWIQSHEDGDALAEIAQLCRQEGWRLATWDLELGLQASLGEQQNVTAADPLGALRAISSLAAPGETALLVLRNYHRFLGSAEIIQALARQITVGKQQRTFVIVLSPVVQLPVELEKQFVILEHPLPQREQLAEIARSLAAEPGELPEGEELDAVLDAAKGLTRFEAEGAFSLSLVRHSQLRPEVIWNLKAQQLKQTGLLALYRGEDAFAELGGLDALKQFCVRAMRRQRDTNPLRRARGVLLLGVPGTGKSAFAKALGNETGRPTLVLDVGSLMGSLVGQTESNVRQALKLADAMAPCVLMIEEVEKALAGVASSGQTDSGVSARLFGTFLSWLNDRTSDVFVIGTCNDIRKLPPEFSRSERFDGVFFLDLPGAAQKRSIWDISLRTFELDPSQPKPKTENWTGAEIRACCRLAALLDLSLVEASQHIVPVAVTAAESVERLRSWASGRCLDADRAGVYVRTSAGESRHALVN